MHTDTTRARSRTAGALLATAIAAAMVLFGATPASALWDPDPVLPRAGFFTQVTITGSQYPTNVTGELTTLAPTPGAYPATGASVEAVSPQLITIADPVSGATASAYCIDFSTETGIGAGYNIGEWDASNVPNLDYINYILNNYFPFNTANPLSGLPLSQQVAAVQSAIWYFSDGFVLATGTNATIRNATAAVVQAALDSGGLPEPALPTLAIDPDTTTVPEDGSIVGPFTVSGTTSGTLDAAVGVEVFLDQAGTQPVPVGTAVAAGTQLWARWTGPAAPVNGFRITAQASLTQGTVYLYDTESSDRPAAQKLVLAQTTTLPLRTGVRATPYASGEVSVQKIIAGDGAGLQDAITIDLACTPAPAEGVVVSATIPAGATSADPVVFTGLPDGATCTVSESADGANDAVTLAAQTIEPETVTVDAAATEPVVVTVTNTYDPVETPSNGGGGGEGGSGGSAGEGEGLAASGPTLMTGPLTVAGLGLLLAGALLRIRRRANLR
ncbi:thioester domain-containing protein [Microbacterium sp.]|uniref:thioester domain-containing protein n=1 Tax=Microbacterium sp. TaxID=51671 RepID=UPI0035AF6FEB